MRGSRRLLIGAGLVAAAAAIGAAVLGFGLAAAEPQVPAQDRTASQATAQDLEATMNSRIYFGHQSVGRNIISGIPEVFGAGEALRVLELDGGATPGLTAGDGVIVHAMVGQNRYPDSKLDAFADTLRAGLAAQVDVAVLKFCYLDVDSGTDVAALFERYRTRLAELEREFPEVTFVYSTVPLRTEPVDLKQLVKEVIGRPNDNAARERFNKLVREEYADTGRLFDIAAVQSTRPDGSRVARKHRGVVHYALWEGYASDPGHLNPTGSARAASEFLAVVGRTAA